MRWTEVRAAYPEQWLIIQALSTRSEARHRLLGQVSVLEGCADGATAHRRYRVFLREQPGRELYFVHTGNAVLDIEERPLLGIRVGDAARAS